MSELVLILADGKRFYGDGFGADPGDLPPIGEVVFNTAMSGYQELSSDPSYRGQLLLFTSCHIGNYGCNPLWSESAQDGLPSGGPQAVVLRNLYEGPLPPGRSSFAQYCREKGICGIRNIDTRALTLHIRKQGSVNAVLLPRAREREGEKLLAEHPPMEGRALAAECGVKSRYRYGEGSGGVHILLMDYGLKDGIRRELLQRGVQLTVLPGDSRAEDVAAYNPDGILLSNGPGDPAVLSRQISTVKELLGHFPIMGICLGHQLLALALGGKTRKMEFGHHGANHPVRDLYRHRVYVTSQNHGFEVLESSLPPDTEVLCRNTNDGSLEGFCHPGLRILSLQFHPEAAPGPREASSYFDHWLNELKEAE